MAPVDRRYDARSQSLLLHACPMPGPEPGVAGWTMTRVVLVGGPAFARAAAAVGALTAVLLGSAAWLGWLLLGWSRRLRRIEEALASPAEGEIPLLPPTGQRDIDRIVRAVNEASRRVAEARRAASAAASRAASAERLAAIGRMAAGVAHEVRNPIAAMRLKAENALLSRDPDRMARALNLVLDQVGRLDALSTKLLASARGDDALLAPAQTDLTALLTGRLDLFREQAEAAGVQLEASPPPREPAWLDAGLMTRALDNLVLNALQNTPAGGRVTLAVTRRGDTLVLEVADTGRGVPETIRPNLFEPFVSARPEGTGLGLALVREAVKAHSGVVRALHRPEGTTIQIELPGVWQPS
jgi:signal transduction histidine kinase